MSISEAFQSFLKNIAVDNAKSISDRYAEITRVLNTHYRNTEPNFSNSLQVGSYGRWTAIKGISDLDMLYIMPRSTWSTYQNGGQAKLLADTAGAIKARYPTTVIRVDRLVVRVMYGSFHVEVQPVFEQDDRSFLYPDTYYGGSWKKTKPRDEIAAMTAFHTQTNANLRRLCKMVRAWKNKHGVAMGGLLVDTLAHGFLKSNREYDEKSYYYYDLMSRDFFQYIANLPKQEYFLALGSGQRVKVKKNFQAKALKTYELSLKAIQSEGKDNRNEKWRAIFGRGFPAAVSFAKSALAEDRSLSTEKFIESRLPVDVYRDIQIDCEVTQDGFRPTLLRHILQKNLLLMPKKRLRFYVAATDIVGKYDLYWKVLNRGEEAIRRSCVRGQIVADGGHKELIERTTFRGDHVVECYAVLDGVVVATDRIHVPISSNEENNNG